MTMKKKVIDYLKCLVIKRNPRFVSLGQDGPLMYFIDCYTGDVWRLGKDYSDSFEKAVRIATIR